MGASSDNQLRIAAALEIILPAGHLLEPEVRTAQDVVKVRCLNIGFQIDLCLARKCSGGSSGKHVHPGELLLQRIKRITLFDDLIMRAPIDRKPGVNALALFIKCVFLTPFVYAASQRACPDRRPRRFSAARAAAGLRRGLR